MSTSLRNFSHSSWVRVLKSYSNSAEITAEFSEGSI